LDETAGSRYSPVIQLRNLTGTQAWASAELPFIGSSPYNHTPDHFISQKVDLIVFDDAPPFVGQIHVQLLDNATDEWLLTDEAQASVQLPDVIPITGGTPSAPLSEQVYIFADAIALGDVEIKHDDGALVVDVVWQLRQPLPVDDLKLFIHALDANGKIVGQVDAMLFRGDYPPRYWRPDQNLSETYQLPDDAVITQLAMGLYTPENRLPVTVNGQPLADGRIVINVP
jgi:hypothetical protein